MMNIQERFIEQAIIWANNHVPYLHRGVTRFGCDCTGLIIGIARELGFMGEYKLRNYSPDWNKHSGAGNYIAEEIGKIANEIPKPQTENGDLVIIRFYKCLAHVGILIDKDNGKFVHSLDRSKRCEYGILKNSEWGRRWEKTFRFDEDKMRTFVNG